MIRTRRRRKPPIDTDVATVCLIHAARCFERPPLLLAVELAARGVNLADPRTQQPDFRPTDADRWAALASVVAAGRHPCQ